METPIIERVGNGSEDSCCAGDFTSEASRMRRDLLFGTESLEKWNHPSSWNVRLGREGPERESYGADFAGERRREELQR